MKIFSLESKISLVGWSVVLGLVIYFVDNVIFSFVSFDRCTSTLDDMACSVSLGQKFLIFDNLYLSLGIWVLLVFIILSLVRYFKKKNFQMTPKQN